MLFDCQFTLSEEISFSVPIREDGFVNATKLCQGTGKSLDNWRRAVKTLDFIEKLNMPESIEVYTGGDNRGTWVHPDLAIYLSQCCSAYLDVQLAEWLRKIKSKEIKPISPPETKRCGGLSHTKEEDRILPLSEFHKNKANTDGYAHSCKKCYRLYKGTKTEYKPKPTETFDNETHKWCSKCETVKTKSEFFSDKSSKDGLYANCKNCKYEQKKLYRAKKKAEK